VIQGKTKETTNPKDDLEKQVSNFWTRKTGLEGKDGVAGGDEFEKGR